MSFSITINQLSPNSQNYLKQPIYTETSLPESALTFESLVARGKNSQEILTILNELIKCEDDFSTVNQEQLKHARASIQKRKAWTIGVTLITLVLLTTASLLILFFPPAAAIILPVFATIGHWSPLLVLMSFLPSVILSIGSLIKLSHCKKLQKVLEKNQSVSAQLEDAQDYLLRIDKKATMPSSSSNNVQSTLLTRPGGIFRQPKMNTPPESENKENLALHRASSSHSV